MPDAAPQFTQETLVRAGAMAHAIPEANTLPLPGDLAAAFLPEPLLAAGLELRPVVASHEVELQWAGSPVHRLLGELTKEPELREDVVFTPDQVVELIFILCRPLPEVRAARRAGREAFTESAWKATLDQQTSALPQDVATARDAALIHYVQSVKTRLQYGVPEKPGEGFTPPPPGAATGSDGGSITNAGSCGPSRNSPAPT